MRCDWSGVENGRDVQKEGLCWLHPVSACNATCVRWRSTRSCLTCLADRYDVYAGILLQHIMPQPSIRRLLDLLRPRSPPSLHISLIRHTAPAPPLPPTSRHPLFTHRVWLFLIKIFNLTGLILLGLIIYLGRVSAKELLGFTYWKHAHVW